MKIKISVLFFGLTFLFNDSFGQKKSDSTIIRKCFKELKSLSSLSNINLFDSIKPDKSFTYWEVNANYGGNFKNYYRSNKQTFNDTTLSIKSNSGFGTICPPDGCFWYISTTMLGQSKTIENISSLSNFIGTIDNIYDAYLWLSAQNLTDSKRIPISTNPSIKYKLLDKGYLISMSDLMISDCPVTYGTLIYFVAFDKTIIHIKTIKTEITRGCI